MRASLLYVDFGSCTKSFTADTFKTFRMQSAIHQQHCVSHANAELPDKPRPFLGAITDMRMPKAKIHIKYKKPFFRQWSLMQHANQL